MRKLATFLMVLSVLVVSVTPTFAQDDDATILEIVAAQAESGEEFTILAQVVAAADPSVAELLNAPDAGITVFAPTDAAFNDILAALGMTPEEVLADTDFLTLTLASHVAPVALTAEDVVALDGAYVGTFVEDTPLFIMANDDGVYIDGATVVATDIMASNGVVHVIDTVLQPDMVGMGDMMMDDDMGDDMEGDDMEGDDMEGDMEGDDMEGDDMEGDDMSDDMDDDMMMSGSLADVVIASAASDEPEFTVLLAAVQAADPVILSVLSGDLSSGPQPITVFAPTDAAFAAAFEALGVTPEDVLADTETLNGILAYHILPGAFKAGGITDMAEREGGEVRIATAIPGLALTFVLDDMGGLTVNGIEIIWADAEGTNGFAHAIDGVLLPQ